MNLPEINLVTICFEFVIAVKVFVILFWIRIWKRHRNISSRTIAWRQFRYIMKKKKKTILFIIILLHIR